MPNPHDVARNAPQPRIFKNIASIGDIFAENERQLAMIGWLAECAAKQGCPVNEITCDKFLNAGCECPESANLEYRKHCWEHAASAVIAARKEQDNA